MSTEEIPMGGPTRSRERELLEAGPGRRAYQKVARGGREKRSSRQGSKDAV